MRSLCIQGPGPAQAHGLLSAWPSATSLPNPDAVDVSQRWVGRACAAVLEMAWEGRTSTGPVGTPDTVEALRAEARQALQAGGSEPQPDRHPELAWLLLAETWSALGAETPASWDELRLSLERWSVDRLPVVDDGLDDAQDEPAQPPAADQPPPSAEQRAAQGLELRFWMACTLSHLQVRCGRARAGLQWAQMAAELAHRSGIRWLSDSAALAQAEAQVLWGDLDAAHALLERRMAQAMHATSLHRMLLSRSLCVLMQAGRLGEAQSLASRWPGLVGELRRRPEWANRVPTAWLLLESGQAEAAAAVLAPDGTMSGQRPQWPDAAAEVPRLGWLLARLMQARGDLAAAQSWVRRALLCRSGDRASPAERTALKSLASALHEAAGSTPAALVALREAQAECLLWVAHSVRARLQTLLHASRPPMLEAGQSPLAPPRETRSGATGYGLLEPPVAMEPPATIAGAEPPAIAGHAREADRVDPHALRLHAVAEAATRAAEQALLEPETPAGRLLAEALAERLTDRSPERDGDRAADRGAERASAAAERIAELPPDRMPGRPAAGGPDRAADKAPERWSPALMPGSRATPLPWLAHLLREIRDPEQGSLGLTALLELSSLDARWRQQRAVGLMGGARVQAREQDLADLQALLEGQLTLVPVELDLAALLDALREQFGPLAGSRGLELRSDRWGLPQRPVIGDPGRIRQVLAHLLDNAIRYTRRGHVVLRCHGRRPVEGGALLSFMVADTGPGLDRRWRDRLRADVAWPLPAPDEPHGRGLPLCQRLVALMGGQLWIETGPGLGCQVGFNLQLALAGEAPLQPLADPGASEQG